MADDDTLTLDKLRQTYRLLAGGPSIFATPSVLAGLRQLPRPDPIESLFGSPIGSYLGVRLYQAPERLYRPPDKPLRSAPRRKWWRPSRKRVQAERVKLRPLLVVYHCRWLKSRKVPDRRGWPQTTCFIFNTNALC